MIYIYFQLLVDLLPLHTFFRIPAWLVYGRFPDSIDCLVVVSIGRHVGSPYSTFLPYINHTFATSEFASLEEFVLEFLLSYI